MSGIFLCFLSYHLTVIPAIFSLCFNAGSFKYSGTMALTTYLSQTLICLWMVRVFGLYGTLTLTESTVICLIIYTLQLFLNKWWLYYFYYGPCEWLWRSFTYRSLRLLGGIENFSLTANRPSRLKADLSPLLQRRYSYSFNSICLKLSYIIHFSMKNLHKTSFFISLVGPICSITSRLAMR